MLVNKSKRLTLPRKGSLKANKFTTTKVDYFLDFIFHSGLLQDVAYGIKNQLSFIKFLQRIRLSANQHYGKFYILSKHHSKNCWQDWMILWQKPKMTLKS